MFLFKYSTNSFIPPSNLNLKFWGLVFLWSIKLISSPLLRYANSFNLFSIMEVSKFIELKIWADGANIIDVPLSSEVPIWIRGLTTKPFLNSTKYF